MAALAPLATSTDEQQPNLKIRSDRDLNMGLKAIQAVERARNELISQKPYIAERGENDTQAAKRQCVWNSIEKGLSSAVDGVSEFNNALQQVLKKYHELRNVCRSQASIEDFRGEAEVGDRRDMFKVVQEELAAFRASIDRLKNAKALKLAADEIAKAVQGGGAAWVEQMQSLDKNLNGQLRSYDSAYDPKIEPLQEALNTLCEELSDLELDRKKLRMLFWTKKADRVEESVDRADRRAQDAAEEAADENSNNSFWFISWRNPNKENKVNRSNALKQEFQELETKQANVAEALQTATQEYNDVKAKAAALEKQIRHTQRQLDLIVKEKLDAVETACSRAQNDRDALTCLGKALGTHQADSLLSLTTSLTLLQAMNTQATTVQDRLLGYFQDAANAYEKAYDFDDDNNYMPLRRHAMRFAKLSDPEVMPFLGD